ncbi:uncharacterized protein BYT42DRAFT_575665 [Radiomyces spectabilis]|uniref:uncharacterized protein n=1 Tax=Radiomyces spectabilis TaxID=64574 RepID=UPI00222068E3|nr:uncharacterized protein BYT42DRAFT_575665 [Radiomyces spectabilis]KAI8374244.1 hypothetical protein BYT42DRAFT_575665 [Radiomyces spectabilis]
MPNCNLACFCFYSHSISKACMLTCAFFKAHHPTGSILSSSNGWAFRTSLSFLKDNRINIMSSSATYGL